MQWDLVQARGGRGDEAAGGAWSGNLGVRTWGRALGRPPRRRSAPPRQRRCPAAKQAIAFQTKRHNSVTGWELGSTVTACSPA